MKQSFIFIIISIFVCLQSVYPQITTNEEPISIQRGVVVSLAERARGLVNLPAPDVRKLLYEDSIFQEKDPDALHRTSVPIPVTIDINRDGIWTSLEDGGKLWQIAIHSSNALALDFVFSKFWLPQGGKFFIFNPSTKESIGAITSQYLSGERNTPHRFSTGIIKGENIVLEYYQPDGVEMPNITLEKAYYTYIPVPGFNTSCNEEVNVNCSEGSNWQAEKDAVALVYGKFNQAGVWSSGSLINNTRNDSSPLFLSTNHIMKCDLSDEGGYIEIKDAYGDNDLSDWVFYWAYELPTCYGNTQPSYNKTTVGAILKANNSYSDFALLQLQQNPMTLSGYVPYYLGWDASGNPGTGGVCIHHPKSDVKKISKYDCTPQTASFNTSPSVYWEVQWMITDHGHGVTEKGSSGSSLINSSHRVIGQLRGGSANCSNLSGTSKYGKLCVSWSSNNNDSIGRRLNCWLDSLNTGVQIMEGLLIIPTSVTMNNDQYLYSNIRIMSTGQLIVQSNIELTDYSCVIVEAGGQLIIDGGTLSNVDIVLKVGASLQIINGGIIETRNGFEAPLGAIVEIVHGQIL